MNKRKKVYASTLSVSLLAASLLSQTAVGAANFTDLTQAEEWAKPGIQRANEMGVVQGYPGEEYRPTATVSRAEAAAVFAKLLKLDLSADESSFSDISPEFWYAPYVQAVQRAGLMNGVGGGRFNPEGELTREQLAVIWVKAAVLDLNGDNSNLSFGSGAPTGKTPGSYDVSLASDWAKPYLTELNRLGISLNASGSKDSRGEIQRQELAFAASEFAPIYGQMRIDSIDGDIVTIEGTPYTVTDEVRGLLREVNEDALRNNELRFQTDGNRITAITYLATGRTTDRQKHVLDAGNTRIERLRLTDTDTEVRAARVGDLIIDRTAQSGAVLNGIQVAGTTFVRTMPGELETALPVPPPVPPPPAPAPPLTPVPTPSPSSPPVTPTPDPVRNVTAITVSGSGNAETVNQGGSLQMVATITPDNATNRNVTWSIDSNGGVGSATISANGLLTGVTEGTVTVRATANDGSGVYGTRVITVVATETPVTNITVTAAGSAETVTAGQTLLFSADVTPINATNRNVTWSVTGGTGTATIDPASGLLTAQTPGTVTVTATASDGSNVTGSRTVTVQAAEIPITAVTISTPDGDTVAENATLALEAEVAPNGSNQEV
uniref:Ig-like domain-containing protein n=1 Tax=Saccharibacillus deserti TaxID=1634444 RepID=UPI0015550F3A